MLALNDIQEHFYNRILEASEYLKNQENQRITNKIQTDGEKLHATLHELGNIVADDSSKKKGTFHASGIAHDNLLLASCQQIGEKVGFDFASPKYMESYDDSLTNQLFAIGQASNVRIRKVILRGTWWASENGHMLAFTKEDKKPIALLQKDA